MAELAIVAGGVKAIGTIIGGDMSATAMTRAGDAKAKALAGAAVEARAVSQRDMFEQQRRARLALSTLTARAAASGDAPNSGDIVKAGGEIAARGEYLALAELYKGESRARGLEDEAAATLWGAQTKAKATRIGSYFDAAGSILSAGGRAAAGGSLPTRDYG